MLVAHGDVSEPRFRLIGRYLLSLALYGCDSGRRFWRLCQNNSSVAEPEHSSLYHRGYGGTGWWGNRSRDDRCHNDL